MKVYDKASVFNPVIVVLPQRTDYGIFYSAALQRHLDLDGAFIHAEPRKMRFICGKYFYEFSGDLHRILLRLFEPRRKIVVFDIVSILKLIGRRDYRSVPRAG